MRTLEIWEITNTSGTIRFTTTTTPCRYSQSKAATPDTPAIHHTPVWKGVTIVPERGKVELLMPVMDYTGWRCSTVISCCQHEACALFDHADGSACSAVYDFCRDAPHKETLRGGHPAPSYNKCLIVAVSGLLEDAFRHIR